MWVVKADRMWVTIVSEIHLNMAEYKRQQTKRKVGIVCVCTCTRARSHTYMRQRMHVTDAVQEDSAALERSNGHLCLKD